MHGCRIDMAGTPWRISPVLDRRHKSTERAAEMRCSSEVERGRTDLRTNLVAGRLTAPNNT